MVLRLVLKNFKALKAGGAALGPDRQNLPSERWLCMSPKPLKRNLFSEALPAIRAQNLAKQRLRCGVPHCNTSNFVDG